MCVCVCVRVRVSDKQEQASSNLFVIAIISWVRVSDKQEHSSTDLFVMARVYVCACAHTCVRACAWVRVFLTNKCMTAVFAIAFISVGDTDDRRAHHCVRVGVRVCMCERVRVCVCVCVCEVCEYLSV